MKIFRYLLPLSSLELFPKSLVSAMAPPLSVRVASYNVLSSHLADPQHFSTLNPDHLYAKNRLPAVLQKIDEEIHQNSIICLQEVSYDWAGSFHAHFANRGYHLVTGLYGKKFNGYMGVGIGELSFQQKRRFLVWYRSALFLICHVVRIKINQAFPTAGWNILDVDISR
jgi:hypothetical protein